MPEQPSYAPDLDELEQRDDIAPTAVAVRIEEPARTIELPSRCGVMRTVRLTDSAELLVGRDLRRKSTQVQVAGAAVYLGGQQDVTSGIGFTVADGGSLTWAHCEEVWARAATGDTADVSLLVEVWAD